MGMFDTVLIPCPTCRRSIERQSKAGPCELDEYTLSNAPIAVLADLDKEVLQCAGCGQLMRVHIRPAFSVEIISGN